MDLIVSFLAGHLSAAERVWSALAPAVALIALVLLALLAYVVRTLVFGRFHDEEMDGRGLGGLTTARARHFFAWMMRPLWRGLAAAEVPPNAITTLSVGFAVGAGLAAAVGRFSLAGWVFLGAGALDFLDGRVARVTGRASRGGAALDSVLDRYCEAALLVGLAWYYRGSWVLMPVLLALTGSLFVPYVRARGEALGAKLSDVGFMQRPERIIVLGTTVALAPVVEALMSPSDPHPPHRLAIAGLVLLALTSHGTALQRLVHLVRTLGNAPPLRFRLIPRAIAVSIAATLSDFSSMRALLAALPISLPVATLFGCLVGGAVAFSCSRFWAFHAERMAFRRQLVRFAFVSGTSALLNAGGVALLLLLPSVGSTVAWLVTRALVFVCWNFPLSSEWAFAAPRDGDDRGSDPPPTLHPDELGGKSAPGAS
jgi:phosphatidylglycerophosphate synthase/putative flippase GtrA